MKIVARIDVDGLIDENAWTHLVIVRGRYGNIQVFKNGTRFFVPDAWQLEIWNPPVRKKKWWEFWK